MSKFVLLFCLLANGFVCAEVLWNRMARAQISGYSFPGIEELRAGDMYMRLEQGGVTGGTLEAYFKSNHRRLIVSYSYVRKSIQINKRAIFYLDKRGEEDDAAWAFLDVMSEVKSRNWDTERRIGEIGDDQPFLFAGMNVDGEVKYIGRTFWNREKLSPVLQEAIKTLEGLVGVLKESK